jgi:hypothetical protein
MSPWEWRVLRRDAATRKVYQERGLSSFVYSACICHNSTT